MASTGTPSSLPFSFALSEDQSSVLNKGSPKAEALANPLLAKNGSTPKKPSIVGDTPITSLQRMPLAPVNNTGADGLRQRIKQKEVNGTNGSSTLPPPPKVSLTMGGGFVGAKKERRKVGNGNGALVSWGRMDSPPPAPADNDTAVLDDSFDRWVLVYGYATSAQYDAILRRFDTFGKVTSRRGTCRPGTSNWVALQYESSLQAEKALCQQHCMILDGILVGVTRMDPSMRQSLEWNVMAPPPATSEVDEGSSARKERLDDKFRASLDQTNSYGMREQDILLMGGDSTSRSSPDGKKNVCERFLSWVFEW